MHGATPTNLAQGGLILSNGTFSYPRAGARCTGAIWGANGSHRIFSKGRELNLLVVSHENTVEFATRNRELRSLLCTWDVYVLIVVFGGTGNQTHYITATTGKTRHAYVSSIPCLYNII
jgi:hypothetical protein